MTDQTQKAKEVKQRYEKGWLAMNGVTAVGIGLVQNEVGIIISVEKDKAKVQAQIPHEIDGIPTSIRLTGRLNAQ
jgi:hypothetical protein